MDYATVGNVIDALEGKETFFFSNEVNIYLNDWQWFNNQCNVNTVRFSSDDYNCVDVRPIGNYNGTSNWTKLQPNLQTTFGSINQDTLINSLKMLSKDAAFTFRGRVINPDDLVNRGFANIIADLSKDGASGTYLHQTDFNPTLRASRKLTALIKELNSGFPAAHCCNCWRCTYLVAQASPVPLADGTKIIRESQLKLLSNLFYVNGKYYINADAVRQAHLELSLALGTVYKSLEDVCEGVENYGLYGLYKLSMSSEDLAKLRETQEYIRDTEQKLKDAKELVRSLLPNQ